ncbi:hypothetical protein RISK_006003 [Rhodopirellula islandica]|uniref:Uncharacterized protein n=1 Tax=Rhodopirellula islandica TaxID=595434 RepID=A0A0J1E8M7_RHOIS|nr:hypothetical protein RISK_006003 [Rhodopirellula islandica]
MESTETKFAWVLRHPKMFPFFDERSFLESINTIQRIPIC